MPTYENCSFMNMLALFPQMAFEGCIWLAVALTMQALDALLM